MKKALLCLFILLISSTPKIFSQHEESIETILEEVMAAAEKYSESVEDFEAEIYMRVYVQTVKKNFLYRFTHLIPKFVMHDRHSNEGVIEVISDLKFIYPNNFTADIKNLVGTFSQKNVSEMLPSNLLYLNVYSKMSCNERFFMPLNKASKKYYNYELKRTFREDGLTFCTIAYTPIYESPKLLKGTFVIERDSWRVVQFVAEGLDRASSFTEIGRAHV